MATVDIDPACFDGLDPVFREQDFLLTSVANWVDLLLAPRDNAVVHPAQAIDNTTDADDNGGYNPYAGDSNQLGRADNRPPDLPMTGVTLQDFFRPAFELSGQNGALFDHAYGVVVNASISLPVGLRGSTGSDAHGSASGERVPDGGPSGDGDSGKASGEYVGGLQGAMEHVFAHWGGDAATACSAFVGNVVTFVDVKTQTARDIAAAVSAYWGAIVKARENLIAAMTEFCALMHQRESSDAVAEHQREVTRIGQLIGFGLAAAGVTSELGLSLFIASQVNTIGASAVTAQLTQGGATYADIARSYLHNAQVIIDDLRAQVEAQILPQLYRTAESITRNSAPTVGRSLDDFDKSHGQLVPD